MNSDKKVCWWFAQHITWDCEGVGEVAMGKSERKKNCGHAWKHIQAKKAYSDIVEDMKKECGAYWGDTAVLFFVNLDKGVDPLDDNNGLDLWENLYFQTEIPINVVNIFKIEIPPEYVLKYIKDMEDEWAEAMNNQIPEPEINYM